MAALNPIQTKINDSENHHVTAYRSPGKSISPRQFKLTNQISEIHFSRIAPDYIFWKGISLSLQNLKQLFQSFQLTVETAFPARCRPPQKARNQRRRKRRSPRRRSPRWLKILLTLRTSRYGDIWSIIYLFILFWFTPLDSEFWV